MSDNIRELTNFLILKHPQYSALHNTIKDLKDEQLEELLMGELDLKVPKMLNPLYQVLKCNLKFISPLIGMYSDKPDQYYILEEIMDCKVDFEVIQGIDEEQERIKVLNSNIKFKSEEHRCFLLKSLSLMHKESNDSPDSERTFWKELKILASQDKYQKLIAMIAGGYLVLSKILEDEPIQKMDLRVSYIPAACNFKHLFSLRELAKFLDPQMPESPTVKYLLDQAPRPSEFIKKAQYYIKYYYESVKAWLHGLKGNAQVVWEKIGEFPEKEGVKEFLLKALGKFFIVANWSVVLLNLVHNIATFRFLKKMSKFIEEKGKELDDIENELKVLTIQINEAFEKEESPASLITDFNRLKHKLLEIQGALEQKIKSAENLKTKQKALMIGGTIFSVTSGVFVGIGAVTSTAWQVAGVSGSIFGCSMAIWNGVNILKLKEKIAKLEELRTTAEDLLQKFKEPGDTIFRNVEVAKYCIK